MGNFSPVTTSAPLLDQEDTDVVSGVVDHRGRPASRSRSGGWRSASIVAGVQLGERFAFAAIYVNLISYLTGPMGQSTTVAAENVNVWSSICFMLPICGAFLADSYLGRYMTIFFFSILYILGLGMLTLTAATMSSLPMADSKPAKHQVVFFFTSLYLLGIGQSAQLPSTQAFGADQFDQLDQNESGASSSFFNWSYFGICVGSITSIFILTYVQENIGWALGYGVSLAVMVGTLLLFLAGTTTYRYKPMEGQSAFVRVVKEWVAKIFVRPNQLSSGSKEKEDEYNSILQLIPIWAICCVITIAHAQAVTFFTEQGRTMNRTISPHFQISPANLQIIIFLTSIIILPVYDRVLVPVARSFTGISSGITVLQRIGIGAASAMLSMLAAAMVETRRLDVARAAGVVDQDSQDHYATLPTSVWWLVPQFVLMGISQLFMLVGMSEFFNNEVPEEAKSFGAAMYLSVSGIGNLLSGVLISVIDKVTKMWNGESWFSSNLNRAHLDYFYWLLAGLCTLALGLYVHFSRSYVYRAKRPLLPSV